MFNKDIDPFENVISFIGAAIETPDLQQMLLGIEKLPDNIRRNTIKKIIVDIGNDKEFIEFIPTMKMIMDKKILEAMNNVIVDIQKNNLRSINTESISNITSYTVLAGLITAL